MSAELVLGPNKAEVRFGYTVLRYVTGSQS